jgi:hypothetical protein
MANKCTHLVSAKNLSLDPTLLTIASHTVNTNDDEGTVITSNRYPHTQIKTPREHDRQSLAATAQEIFGNPMPQYLNALTIAANEAIADTSATTIFIMDDAEVNNKLSRQNPSKVIYSTLL